MPPHRRAVPLALLDALCVGMGIGYLARQYREAIVANPGTIGLGLVVALAAAYVVWVGARILLRANARIDTIFAEELHDKPSPWPR
jgi:hypothetical protein